VEALFDWGTESEGPEELFNLESQKCHFLNFGKDLTKFRWSENSILVCQNLQFQTPPGWHDPEVKYNHCLSHASVGAKS
jgi:hypothetical protein